MYKEGGRSERETRRWTSQRRYLKKEEEKGLRLVRKRVRREEEEEEDKLLLSCVYMDCQEETRVSRRERREGSLKRADKDREEEEEEEEKSFVLWISCRRSIKKQRQRLSTSHSTRAVSSMSLNTSPASSVRWMEEKVELLW